MTDKSLHDHPRCSACELLVSERDALAKTCEELDYERCVIEEYREAIKILVEKNAEALLELYTAIHEAVATGRLGQLRKIDDEHGGRS